MRFAPEILGGILPPGRRLREEHLAERFGASRHTVRSALAALTADRLLAADRLLPATPYQGARVTVFDDEQLLALQGPRRALECEAVRMICKRNGGVVWSDDDLIPIMATVDELIRAEATMPQDWIGVECAHAAVHLSIVERAGSARIPEAHRAIGDELSLLLLHTRPLYSMNELSEQPLALIEDVQRRGEAAIREHLADSTARLLAQRAADHEVRPRR